MHSFLEISGNDIAALNEIDLRELIGLLCEADYNSHSLSISGIGWSGHSNAKDGGFDVFVNCKNLPPTHSHIPKNVTGFQVKKSNMFPNNIKREMKPNGKLRQKIADLHEKQGAYIIVSSNANTTDSAYDLRIHEMKESIGTLKIEVDFFDQGRIASWVRKYPTLMTWVRSKVGKFTSGWKPYQNWSYDVDDKGSYILDNNARIRERSDSGEIKLSILDGINRLRTLLSKQRASVRLAGLSGVGKTRLIQALFDNTIEGPCLDQTKVIYADTADTLFPTPKILIEQLNSLGSLTILVIDNCPSEMHRILTDACNVPKSFVSLLTVEYDVHDDEPDDTNVLFLEPASDELIEKLITRRFSHIHSLDIKTIIQFAGGNARIAYLLAKTVRQGEIIRGMNDETLFRKLFHQRNSVNEELLRSAQVLSLVYSFDGEDTDEETSELKILASIIGQTLLSLDMDARKIQARDIIQSRGVWRAVLPEALANRLARLSLESFDTSRVMESLTPHRRLLRSFTKRLSYLPESKVAQNIAEIWLKQGGLLGRLKYLSEIEITMLENVTSINPEMVIKTFEREFREEIEFKECTRNSRYIAILREIAFDTSLFKRAVRLIISFCLYESKIYYISSIDSLKSLFQVRYSGTHATLSHRLEIIEELWQNRDQQRFNLSLNLLRTVFETRGLRPRLGHIINSRSRDYGYDGLVYSEDWFRTTMEFSLRLAYSNNYYRDDVLLIIAENLRSLWPFQELRALIFEVCDTISEKGHWSDGWLAIHKIIKSDKQGTDAHEDLITLEKKMAPKLILDRVQAFAINPPSAKLSIHDVVPFDNIYQTIIDLGKELATHDIELAEIAHSLVSKRGFYNYQLGIGIFCGAADVERVWKLLEGQLLSIPIPERNIDILRGWLRAAFENKTAVFDSKKDYILNNPKLSNSYLRLLEYSSIDESELDRLDMLLKNDLAPIKDYETLSWRIISFSISNSNIRRILLGIMSKSGGVFVAAKILASVVRERSDTNTPNLHELKDLSLNVIQNLIWPIDFTLDDELDRDIVELISFSASEHRPLLKELIKNLFNALSNEIIYEQHYSYTLEKIVTEFPEHVLDCLSYTDVFKYSHFGLRIDHLDGFAHQINNIDDDVLITWCDESPHERVKFCLSHFFMFKNGTSGRAEWRPLFWYILTANDNLNDVFEAISEIFDPYSWGGSLADLLERRSVLLDDLIKVDNEELSAWATLNLGKVKHRIVLDRQQDESRIGYNGSFE
jgi:hypothetical protein